MDFDLTPKAELPPLREHPLYAQGMAQSDAGQWQQAFKSFQLLQSIYPDATEAQELLKAVNMRAAVAGVQPRHTSRVTRHLSARRLLLGALMAIAITIVAYVSYEVWISPAVAQEFRLRRITTLRDEADEAIVSGDYTRARQSLQELQAILPEDPQANEALERVEQVERMSALYEEAKVLMEARSWDQAIQALSELQSLDPGYRDLPQLLQLAQESLTLDRQFQAAEEAYARDDWVGAIAQYEALHQAQLAFRFEEIQARLFQSHLKYGQTLLEEAGTDPDQVSKAISQFSEALKLRPLDAAALDERHLAETYLAVLDSADPDQVIDQLLMIYATQPDYAGTAAAQLLYTNLLKRADSFLGAGDEAAAAADYQVAAQLAVEDPSEAQERLADLASEAAP